jgi:hypothetical protein
MASPVSGSKKWMRPGVDHDLDLVAGPDPGAGRERGHEPGPGDLGVGVLLQQLGVLGDHLGRVQLEVDHDLGPQGLDQADGRLQAGVGGGVADQPGVLHVLAADPDRDLPGHIAVQGRSLPGHLRVQRQGGRAEPDGQAVAVLALDLADGHVHRRGADEAGHEDVGRVVVEVLGVADRLEDPGLHHRHPVAHGHGLGLVVGDVGGGGGGVEVVLDLGDLRAHLHPQLGVQVGQGLVHQEHLGLADDGPAHGHPLALAARELLGLAVQQRRQLQHVGHLPDPAVDLGLVHAPDAQPVGDVVGDGHVRVQGIGLEHHGDVAVPGGEGVDHPVADAHGPGREVLQAGHHPQGGRLAAAGRAHQDQELAVGDVQVQVLDGVEPVLVLLVDLVENDLGHGSLLGLAGQRRSAWQSRRRAASSR